MLIDGLSGKLGPFVKYLLQNTCKIVLISDSIHSINKGGSMTPQEVIKHFDNSIPFVAYNLGYSEAAVRKWVTEKKVARRAQILIEALTRGKLKADKPKGKPNATSLTHG